MNTGWKQGFVIVKNILQLYIRILQTSVEPSHPDRFDHVKKQLMQKCDGHLYIDLFRSYSDLERELARKLPRILVSAD